MPQPVPDDRDLYHRLRWQARCITVVAAIPFALMLSTLVTLAGAEDPQLHAAAGLIFFMLGLYTIGAAAALWWAWRRSYRTRPVVLPLDAGPGAAMGVPELDAPPRPHLGLNGEVPPPQRW